MVSNRAYRKSLSPDEALKVIEQSAGKQFDPNLVEIFKSILPEALREIKEYEESQKTATPFEDNIVNGQNNN